MLDGQQGSFYQNASNLNAGTIPDARITDIGDSQARIITFDNLEKSNLTSDGQLGFDSSQGLLVYRAQQGTSGATTTVLDGWNVAAGTNISITNLGSGDTGTGEFTFSVTQGSGSGLDADLWDGNQFASYLNQAVLTTSSPTFNQVITTNNGNGTNVRIGDDAWIGDINSANTIRVQGVQTPANGYIVFGNSNTTALGRAGTGALTYGGNTVWHAGNDGSGSGLDADTVDGISSASFLRSDANDVYTGTLTGAGNISFSGSFIEIGNGSGSVAMTINDGYGNANLCFNHASGVPDVNGNSLRIETNVDSTTGATIVFEGKSNVTANSAVALNQLFTMTETGATCLGNTVWHAGNDGAGSGLDADTVDGIQASSFAQLGGATFTGDLRVDNDADLRIGDGAANERILIQKADNNVSDHIIFYNGTTRIGEIGCQDDTWLRINQVTNKNIYTPRYIRADAGFFVDGTSKGINGSGNFFGGTIAGASDYGLLATLAGNQTFTGTKTFTNTIIGNISGNAATATTATNADQIEIDVNSPNATRNIVFVNGTDGYLIPLVNTSLQVNPGTGTVIATNFSGSGASLTNVNADTVDGIQGASFLRSDADDTASGTITFNGTVNFRNAVDLADNDILRFGSGDDCEFFCNGVDMYMDLNSGIGNFYIRDGTTTRFTFDDNGEFTATGNINSPANALCNKFSANQDITAGGGGVFGFLSSIDWAVTGGTNSNNIYPSCFKSTPLNKTPTSVNGGLVGNFAHFLAQTSSNQTGSSINNQRVFDCSVNLTDTATTTYGFISRLNSGSNTNWNFYAGGTAPSYFNGTIASLGSYNATTASGANMNIASNGDIKRSTSSIRYKTNVEDLEVSYADNIIFNARPVWYRSTIQEDNPEWSYYGLIAEEVAALDERLVFWGKPTKQVIDEESSRSVLDDNGYENYITVEDNDAELQPEGVQYDRLTVLLIDVVQRQRLAIESLEDRITTLENQISN